MNITLGIKLKFLPKLGKQMSDVTFASPLGLFANGTTKLNSAPIL